MGMVSVDEFLQVAPTDLTTDEKNQWSESWIEGYYKEKGKYPCSRDLVKLADWLLEDELKDVSRSKVQNTEYPILSKPQIERRYRELSMEQEIVDVLWLKKFNNVPTKKTNTKHVD